MNKNKHKALMPNDIKFLNELQTEMKIQDPLSTAGPRLWVICDYKRLPTSDDYASGYEIFDHRNTETLSEEDLHKTLEELIEEYGDNIVHEAVLKHRNYGIEIPTDVVKWSTELKIELLNEHGNEIELMPYADESFICSNGGSFLTNKAAKAHLERNAHHYTGRAHTYCLSGWRNPQMKKLVEILESTDWTLYK